MLHCDSKTARQSLGDHHEHDWGRAASTGIARMIPSPAPSRSVRNASFIGDKTRECPTNGLLRSSRVREQLVRTSTLYTVRDHASTIVKRRPVEFGPFGIDISPTSRQPGRGIHGDNRGSRDSVKTHHILGNLNNARVRRRSDPVPLTADRAPRAIFPAGAGLQSCRPKVLVPKSPPPRLV